jgi:hypothetical protein
MWPNWNEYPYWKQFEGNLHGSSEPVPMCVSTSVRMMSEEMAGELTKEGKRPDSAPMYVFGRSEDSPLDLPLQATGRHYFRW